MRLLSQVGDVIGGYTLIRLTFRNIEKEKDKINAAAGCDHHSESLTTEPLSTVS